MTQVVTLEREGPIAKVTMVERESKNTFSTRFKHGLLDTFAAIEADPTLKVVVITGYDAYFCCGGTKEELIGIFEGKVQFTDLNFFDILLRCELPVIAAMSGHALGGGLVFGSYADFMILAEECIYTTNFMKYGFTPGMGATLIIPQKFGHLLGTEMLLTAESYNGAVLRERGAPCRIIKKSEVFKEAMRLARTLADKPVLSLKLLKAHLNRHIRAQLAEVVQAELGMHDLSFAQPEVRKRIETLFGN